MAFTVWLMQRTPQAGRALSAVAHNHTRSRPSSLKQTLKLRDKKRPLFFLLRCNTFAGFFKGQMNVEIDIVTRPFKPISNNLPRLSFQLTTHCQRRRLRTSTAKVKYYKHWVDFTTDTGRQLNYACRNIKPFAYGALMTINDY
jgi:hypothetical protein